MKLSKRNACLRLFIIFCLPLLVYKPLTGQDAQRIFDWGLTVGAGINIHSGPFDSLSTISRPAPADPYDNGSGFGAVAGLFARYRLSPAFVLGAQADYEMLDGSFTALETVETINGPGVFTHNLDVRLRMLGLTALVHARPMTSDGFLRRLELSIGLRAAIPLSSEATQTQTTDLDLFPVDLDSTASLASPASPLLSVPLRLGYHWHINKGITLIPAFEFQLGLSTVDADVNNWRVSPARLSLSALFLSPPEERILRDTTIQRDTTVRLIAGLDAERVVLVGRELDNSSPARRIGGTTRLTLRITERYAREIPKPLPLLSASISSSFVLPDSSEADAAVLPLMDVILEDSRPLLPLVYFASGDDALAERYRGDQNGVSANPLLDSIGARLQRIPGAGLRLEHYWAQRSEVAGNDLGRRRCLAVRNYLLTAWEIKADRITIEDVDLFPGGANALLASSGADFVALRTENPVVNAPITSRQVISIPDAPQLRFRSRVISEAGVAEWEVQVVHAATVVKRFKGTADPPETLDWDLDGESLLWSLAPDLLQFKLIVLDHEGQKGSSPFGRIVFEQPDPPSASPAAANIKRRIYRVDVPLDWPELAATKQALEARLAQLRERISAATNIRVFVTEQVTAEDLEKLLDNVAQALAISRDRIKAGRRPTSPTAPAEAALYARCLSIVADVQEN